MLRVASRIRTLVGVRRRIYRSARLRPQRRLHTQKPLRIYHRSAPAVTVDARADTESPELHIGYRISVHENEELGSLIGNWNLTRILQPCADTAAAEPTPPMRREDYGHHPRGTPGDLGEQAALTVMAPGADGVQRGPHRRAGPSNRIAQRLPKEATWPR